MSNAATRPAAPKLFAQMAANGRWEAVCNGQVVTSGWHTPEMALDDAAVILRRRALVGSR